jgi:Dolichyl-phosphate-mannose-protein mannosyltransferase
MNKILQLYKKHKQYWWLAFILLLALGLRCARVTQISRQPRDAMAYAAAADLLANSPDGWHEAFAVSNAMKRLPPMLITVMAFGAKCGLSALSTGIIYNIICGCLLSLGIFLCSRQIFKNYRYALFAAFLIAVSPYCIRISAIVLRDSSYYCWVVFALTAGTAGIVSDKLRYWYFFGFFAALSCLTRREGGELLLGLLLWLTIDIFINEKPFRQSIKKNIMVCLVAIGTFICLTLPIQIMLHNYTTCTWQIVQYGAFKEIIRRIGLYL